MTDFEQLKQTKAQSSASPPHSAVGHFCNKTDKTKEHETMKRVFSERTIVSKVRTILADVLMTDKRSIRREKTLVDDLGADSIDFADSLKCYTRNGRVVYGGGGIMPDIFVPLDTTTYTKSHRAVNAKGSLNRFIVQYFKAHQQELHQQYPTIEDFLDEKSGFKVTDEMVGGIIKQARKDSAQSNELDSLYTNEIFRSQVAAYLANDLYEQGAYSRIMNHTSDVFNAGMAIINDEHRYKELLKSK